MDRLPEEVILHILGFVKVPDIVHLQAVSSRYLALGRDNALWKTECFEDSRAESLRRRNMLLGMQDARIAELRNAVTALPGPDLTAWDVSQLRGSPQPRASNDPAAEARIQRARALANWEPGYPDERLDYYDEYVHRHAPVKVAWLHLPKAQASDKEEYREATGCATLDGEDGNVNHLVAPLDDGSICIWDVSNRSTSMAGGRGRLTAQSRPGLLTGTPPDDTEKSHIMMTETGAVECVSIDNVTRRGYFAVQRSLHEVDINTLQLVSTTHYPWPITALSEAKNTTPLTIGTNWTVHLHDPRDSASASPPPNTTNAELLNPSTTSTTSSHATLAQPGPLSILHDPSPNPSIWLAGRFTSLLHYDRRSFPRLLNTLHSGARIASLTFLPYPLIPQSLDLIRNPETGLSALVAARSAPGTTILAAAEYKGKGSLELYGLPRVQPYQNRQTASASKLLAVAPHGGRIVFSDGDGNLKWVERDGFSHVRTFNINEALPSSSGEGRQSATGEDQSAFGIWSSTAGEMPGQGDIVQKITPMHPVSASSTGTGAASGLGERQRQDVNQSNLLLWTGDGRLGVLGFGPGNPLGEDQWREEVGVAAESTEQRAKGDAERQYGMAMRRALERNADEVRFVRGLGMLV
ncbi:hypothetical protein LTS02_005358 [Friedmanniomyces endolithicus]|nr:hypothetical protein LTS02_005358 [Friedmanniomyces endolithicus]